MSTVPAAFTRLVDDAAIFPPGNLPLPDAVVAHRGHRSSAYAELVGPFVVSDVRLPDLLPLLADEDDDEDADPLAVHVVVTGGAGAIEGAVRWATRSSAVDLRAIEFALRDEDDLAHNAERVIAMLDSLEEELTGVAVYVEPPRLRGTPGPGWLAALDALAARELPLKFRTGSVEPTDVPTSADLAACLDAALDRELPFKCTAGLHHAVSGEGAFGFLNVLAATRATLDGGDVAEVLASTDADALRATVRDDDGRVRRWFHSFGSCSISEPFDDLVALGLIGMVGEQVTA